MAQTEDSQEEAQVITVLKVCDGTYKHPTMSSQT